MRLSSAVVALMSSISWLFGGSVACANTLNVVSSFTVLADVIKNVGGDGVKVRSIVPPNGDPHKFEPSPADAKSLKEADITFISGLGLESWFERLALASGNENPPVVVSEGIKPITFSEGRKTKIDPHVWNSVANVKLWVTKIEAELTKADPNQAKNFSDNADSYIAKLDALNQLIIIQLAEVPLAQRRVLTSHDAFGYYAMEYGVSFLSPLGLSTEIEASAADIATLIDQIRREGVRVYFTENSNDSRLVSQIANATGAKTGGVLYPESLSDENGPASNYIKLMEYNTRQIVRATML
ncbi:zinc ABC transporter solute-binding protein [Pseudomonas sp. S31]|uniref:metal ABC transporter solute-binding protein, Zn/Mn family n=1 Tax=Pseudomonas sp. S31 TaxID=1564473 RepID=UPI001912BF8A|nr:zinc ABC transporter substrate-binding protein [Pseudomonas sp. S31]MBK4998904.1 zinc ABC transporter solute-binding protein [Pseudomonas sp. S31]